MRYLLTMLAGAAAVYLMRLQSVAGDWPQWHGPHRDGVTPESSGYFKGSWNLALLWKSDVNGVMNVGYGVSGPLVVKREGDPAARLYLLRWRDGEDRVLCMDADTGETLWEEGYSCPDYGRTANANKTHYRGPLATPAMDPSNGRLYTLSCDGDLRCWDTTRESERLVWSFNLHARYGGVPAAASEDYGFSASPLLLGDWVVVEVGDDQGNLMAFSKDTGAEAWKSANKDGRGWGSPTGVRVGGAPCVAAVTRDRLLVVRADSGHEGESLVEHAWRSTYSGTIPSPVAVGNKVLFSLADGSGCRSALIDVTLGGYTKTFETTAFWYGVSTAAGYDNHFYFPHTRKVRCVTPAGASAWASGDILDVPHGSFDAAAIVLCAGDRRMIIWSGLAEGELRLAEATPSPASYRDLARVTGVLQRKESDHHAGYSRLALGHGRLVCNTIDGDVACYALLGQAWTLRITDATSVPRTACGGDGAADGLECVAATDPAGAQCHQPARIAYLNGEAIAVCPAANWNREC